MGLLFKTQNVFRIHFFLLFFLSALTSANESTDTALAWLLSQQAMNGSVHTAGDIGTEFQASTEAARALRLWGKSELNQFSQLISYVNAPGLDESTENLARRIATNYRAGISTTNDVSQILMHRNDDGGFGARQGYDSTVIDTSYALLGLGLANYSSSQITNEAIAFVLGEQLSDGSWTNDARPHESITLTSQVLETLRLYSVRFNLQQAITKAVNYLQAQKNSAGAWQNTEYAADSLIALIPVSIDPSQYSAALNSLISSQLPNGSWGNDAYLTARALYSIYLSQNLPPPAVENEAEVTGQLVDQSTGAPVAGANVNVSGASAVAVSSDISGQFVIQVSKTGQYTLAFSASGFKTRSIQVNLSRLQPVNLGQIRLEPLMQVDPTTAVIQGVIIDAVTQLPVPGVDISISGSQSVDASTDANGAYSVTIGSGGASTITIQKSGYQEIRGSANITLGQRILFSPVLYPVGEDAPALAGIKGGVIDSESGIGLSNAKLTLRYLGTFTELAADSSGQFDFNDLAAGEAEILVSAADYREVSIQAYFVAGAILNLGEIKLEKRATSSVLRGVVTNAVDGRVVPFASIKISSPPLSVTSTSNGSYEIANIDSLEFSVETSAPGFETKVTQIKAPEFQAIKLDTALEPINNEKGFGIQSLQSEFPKYSAYKKATLVANFYNNDAKPVDLQMVLELKGENGYYLRAPATHLAFAGDDVPDSLLHFPGSSSSVSVNFEWLTDIIPPGKYEAKLLAYDLNSLQLLAEKATYLEIEPAKQVSALVGSVTPKFSYLNAEPIISLNVDITNQSNVPYELPISYRWRSPDGVIINQGIKVVALVPATYRKFVLLDSFTNKFTKSGNYELEIAVDNGLGIQIGSVVNSTVSVAPSVRIDPFMEITPTIVTPESDKKIKVTFKLKGIEENE